MHSLSCLRVFRILTILLPFAVLTGCGEGQGQQRIQNEPADPFSGPPASCSAALTFEDICDQAFEFDDFEGGVLSIIDNPQIDGNNGSAKVLQMQKFRATSGATFGGSVLDFSAVGSDTINAGDSYTIKVWSQRPVNVLFEPEGGGPGSGDEVAHGGTGWEELTFVPNFTGTTSGFVFIFDNGILGDAADDPDNWTFYIDDISTPQGGDGGPGPSGGFPITFDDGASPTVTEFGGAGFAIEAGPAGGDGNALKIVRDGGEVFAGAWIAVPEIPNDAGEQTISALVFSPLAGIPMVAKVEFGDNMGSGDVSANEPVVAGWQTLTWTFTNLTPPNVYNRFTLLPNLGLVDSGVSYYFDNITLVGAEPPADCSEAITFEDACPAVEFTNFEGGVSDIVDNPDVNVDNPSAKVVRMQKFRAESGFTYGGTVVTFSPPLDALDVPAGSVFTVKVWSQRPVNVLFQPEPAGPGNEVEVAHGGTGWEELTFDLGSFADTVTAWTFIFDNGTLGDAEADPDNWTFYYDDISNPQSGGGGPGDSSFPITFDEATPPAITEFGGAGYAIEAGPAGGDGDALKIVRDGGDVFAGAWVAIPEIPSDLGEQTISALVYSPTAGVPMVVKAEYGENTGTGDTPANETVVVGWQTLTWTFTNLEAGNAYNRFTILPNLGTVDTAKSYYFDNIDLVDAGTGGGGGTVLVTFDETTPPAVTEFGGAGYAIEAGPAGGDGNALKIVRDGGDVFAGAWFTISGIPNDAGAQTLSALVYSPTAGIPMVAKLEFGENTGTGDVQANETVVVGWQTLTWTFTNLAPPNDYNRFVILPNLGTVDTATSYYFDNITLLDAGGGGGGGSASEDFESGSATFSDFEGGVATVIDNPDASGINTSTKVGQMQKFAGQSFAGSTLDLGGAVPFAAGDSYTMKVRALREVVVTMKLEPLGEERTATHSGSGSWEELCFDFTGVSGDVTGITLIFDNGTVGDAAGDPDNWTFQFDDIEQTSAACPTGGGDATTLPVDFEGDINSYDFGPEGGFEGGAASVVTNPDQGGINSSTQVGQMLKYDGAVFGGATLVIEPTTVTAGSSFTMKVWSQRSVPVLLQPEPQGPGSGVEVTHSGTGWEELTFPLPALSGTVSGITIIFDNGTAGAAATDPTNWTFYFDDITLVPGGGGSATTLPVDFQADPASYDFGPDGGFEGGAASVVTNPDQGGINTSTQVGQMLKYDGAVFGGATLAIESATVEAGSSFTMKVWSQRAVPVLLQPEPQGPGSGVEVAHSGTGWEELTFSLPALSGTVSGITIIFDNGTAGAAATDPTNWTFYFDDITLVPPGSGGGGDGTVLVTFDETTPPEVNEFGGAIVTIDAAPAGGDGNALKVLRDGGQVWAGGWFVISGIPNDAGTQTLSALVYSPTAGVPMVAKLEYAENTGTGEVSANETVVAGWQTLTWTFTNLAPPNDYNRFVILPNLGTVDTATSYYIDNITLLDAGGGGGGGGATSTDFESGSATFADFEGGVATVIDNPDASGINTSTKVGQMQKFAGQSFAGSTLDLGGAVPFAAGDSYTMKVRASRSVVVTMKLEPLGEERTASHSGSGSWEELCFDFTGVSGDVTGITLIFDNGTVGDAAGDPDNWTFQFDDIEQTSAACPTGGGDATTLPVDFEGDINSYDFGPEGGFEGGAASVVTNPDQGSINTSTQVGQMLKYDGAVFGGATLAIESATVEAGSSFTMKVWSQRAVPVLLQPEPQGPGSGVEVAHSGTGWEELTFSLPALSGTVSGITIIFDNGTAGAAATDPTNWTFYFDDITLVPPGSGGGGDGTVLVTFDETTPPEVNEFGGAIVTIDAAPAGGDGNALKVLRDGGQVWAGGWFVISGIPNDAGAQTLSARVYSPTAGVPMVAKLEYAENTGTGEVSANETVVEGWQTLTWTFTNLAPPNDYNRFVILPNLGTVDTATSYFIDNITLVDTGGGGGGGGGDATTLPVDFEGDINSYDFGPDGGFEGGAASVVTNPDQTGINTSTQVGQMLKFNGAVFGGATLAIEPVTVEAGSSFTMKVWSQRSVPVLLQPEPQGPGSGIEVTHGGTGWEELSFSLPGLSGTVSGITIIFDNGTAGAAATDPTNWTFYFDDITLLPGGGGGGGTGDGSLPVTFDEATPPAVTEFGGAGYAIEAGPAGGDGKALKIVRDGGDVFAGAFVTVSGIPNDAGAQTISALVYSPTAGIPMVTKLEFAQNMGTGNVSANETVVVGWQTLTWTYTNLAAPNDYSRFVILPNLGTVDTARSYYFDNITLVGAGGGGGGTGDLVVDGGFEAAGTSGLQPPWFVFENGGTVSVSNANNNGGAYSARLQADASSGPSFPILKIERVGAGSVTGGQSVTISFDVIDVDTAGAGKTFVAELFSERSDPPGGATNEIILDGYDLTNSWQTRVFDTNLGADAAGGVSLLFKADCGGNTSCTMDVFVDNVSIVIN